MTHAGQDAPRWRKVAKWTGIAIGALFLIGLVGSAFSYDGDQARRDAAAAAPSTTAAPPAAPEPTGTASSAAPPPTPARAEIGEVVEAMSRLYPLPAPRDNTGSCRAAGCVALTTTDAVSVYEWPDVAGARRWVSGPVEGDAVGRWALTYVSDEQLATSQQAQDDGLVVLREAWRRLDDALPGATTVFAAHSS